MRPSNRRHVDIGCPCRSRAGPVSPTFTKDYRRRARSLPSGYNGPEFTSKAMFLWSGRPGVKLHFIQPGKPTQSAFVESFNGKFRDYCRDLNWFVSLDDARSAIDTWPTHYNHVRPHRSLGKKTPAPDTMHRTRVLVTPIRRKTNSVTCPRNPGKPLLQAIGTSCLACGFTARQPEYTKQSRGKQADRCG
jgi:hypothetical protein